MMTSSTAGWPDPVPYPELSDRQQEILQFLYAECCTRNKALKPQDIVQLCK